MGIYTNYVGSGYASTNYRDVEPYHGEHFNYHELGIIAATESARNRDEFMKAIALSELASVEQYGTEQVFYESVNLGSIFEKVKAFFKKIIEKIHKIFHTFVAKLSSWFGNSRDFAKKYRSEVIKNWSLVKSDWEFKGYKFSCLPGRKDGNFSVTYDVAKNNLKTYDTGSGSHKLADLLNTKNESSLSQALLAVATFTGYRGTAQEKEKVGGGTEATTDAEKKTDREAIKTEISNFRDKMDDWKDKVRGSIVKKNSTGDTNNKVQLTNLNMENSNDGSLDANEFTEELFKAFRSGEDTKTDIKLSDLGSATEVLAYIEDFDKIKEQTEKLESAMTKSIDDLIKAINKAQDDVIKNNKDSTDDNKKLDNEILVGAAALYQSCWGFVKEAQSQAFSAMLQALKDKCAQDKEVCVKIIGLNKKMTESYDYSESYNNNSFGGDFISSVKLV
jgi:hypothetical protein